MGPNFTESFCREGHVMKIDELLFETVGIVDLTDNEVAAVSGGPEVINTEL